MATNTRKLSDFLAEGEGDTFGDLPVGKPHIQLETLYPAWRGLLENNTGLTFTDSSTTGHAVVENVGDVHHSGVQNKVGSTAIRFDGSAQNSIRYADSADWDFGTGAFTIECWINPSIVNSGARTVCARTVNDSTVLWMLRITASARLEFTLNNTSGSDHESSSYTVVANTWTHIAITRGGPDNKVRLYANGTNIYTSSAVDGGSYDGSGEWWFGANPTGSQNYIGYIDEFRYVKGLAVYTGNFTAPTSALTTTWSAGTNIAANSTASNVKLLLHSDAGGHSGAYGTAQTDGKKYYYTDINGSKPIKDPRIGTHFGCQRHTLTSIQEQTDMTAIHGKAVFTFEGKEWVKGSGNTTAPYYGFGFQNDENGSQYEMHDGSYIEITGYFSDANLQAFQYSSNRHFTWSVDGGTRTTDTSFRTGTNIGPAAGRFNSAAGWNKIGLGATLGIHTLKIETVDQDVRPYAFELIAQDTTSTATKSKVQIPAQNVVSYGKKFTTTAATHHYDPFNGFTNGTSLHSAFVDTATSLGLDTAPGLSAKWAISNTNNIRPYNGGRVVKWIASDGTIKTSVNMMPPNAQNHSKTASNEITTPSATNTTTTPNFSNDTVDFSQSEIAKEYYIREFGNGSCNGHTNASGNKADFSMLNPSQSDDIVYVMDDGLTGACANGIISGYEQVYVATNNEAFQITWIGTGITGDGDNLATLDTWALNLPYGTHLMRYTRNSTLGNSTIKIDGIQVHNAWLNFRKFTFHQPKMPPIPEDACIIADYMLMADHVPQTDGGASTGKIGKGVRRLSCDRDHFYNNWNGSLEIDQANAPYGLKCTSASGSTVLIRNVGFATNFVRQTYGQTARAQNWYVNDTGHSSADARTGVGGAWGSICDLDANITLGNNVLDTYGATGDGNSVIHGSTDFVSPTHTSSHYQEYETFLKKGLMGGDRNMEQTNLVVTPEGKTWDEVTRDTSYIGNARVHTGTTTNSTSGSTNQVFDYWRGHSNHQVRWMNKDFAIAYDRVICLVEGWYEIHSQTLRRAATTHCMIKISNEIVMYAHAGSSDHDTPSNTLKVFLKRGDYIQNYGGWFPSVTYGHFQISKI